MNKKYPLYTCVLEDNSVYFGGTEWTETLWNTIDKPIKRINYLLPDGNVLTLHGYKKYYHMIEVTTDLTGKNKGNLNFEFAYIMGMKASGVRCYKINLKTGEIEVKLFDIVDDFICGLNNRGFKQGV